LADSWGCGSARGGPRAFGKIRPGGACVVQRGPEGACSGVWMLEGWRNKRPGGRTVGSGGGVGVGWGGGCGGVWWLGGGRSRLPRLVVPTGEL